MAGGSLLMLLDDIASILDDVSAMSQVAARKTAGVLGDDLALNAHQVNGVSPDRELPVVWAVARGSFLNKAILVPAALIISALAPWIITPLLMLGGAFLCFEGAEKIIHRLLHGAEVKEAHDEIVRLAADPTIDLVTHERDKIRGAVRTDFILSAEIIIITLGVVADSDLVSQIVVLSGIAVVMTAGVYGLVAAIVKFDDVGLYLSQREGTSAGKRLVRRSGHLILHSAPLLLKGLTFVGTIAMFLVGGGILVHGVEPLGHTIEAYAPEGLLGMLYHGGVNGGLGVAAGCLLVAGMMLLQRIRGA